MSKRKNRFAGLNDKSKKSSDWPTLSNSSNIGIDNNKLKSSMMSILQDTDVIERYIKDKNILNKLSDQSSDLVYNDKEVADKLKTDKAFINLVMESILKNEEFKQSIYQVLSLEYQKKTLTSWTSPLRTSKKKTMNLN